MAAFMVSAWECLAKGAGASMWDFPVVFEDVLVLAPVRGERGVAVTLNVSLDKSQRFQVNTCQSMIVDRDGSAGGSIDY